MRRTTLATVLILIVTACGGASGEETTSTASSDVGSSTSAAAGEPTTVSAGQPARVVLVGGQAFGDQGPMDDMAGGLQRCASDFGFEVTQLESLTPLEQEEDIRALAADGYDLIFTAFPDMTPATTAVAADYPDTMFGAVYQFINVEETVAPNVWDTEYKAEGTNYVFGVIAANLSQTGRLGYVAGAEDPTINAGINAFIQGARDTSPEIEIDVAFADSWEDIAKGKEIGLAMANRDIDFIQTAAARTQLGVLAAASEKGILFSGDVGDNSAEYPEGFVGFLGSTFGENIYQGCESFADGSFPAGEHTFMDLSNGAYYVPFDVMQAWEASTEWPGATGTTEQARDLVHQVTAGEIDVVTNPDTPQP